MSDPNFSDEKFSRYFIGMIIAMIILTAVLMVFASYNASEVNEAKYAETQQRKIDSIAKQIAPVGKLAIDTVTNTMPVAQAEEKSGEEVYNGACAACHTTGAAGAPIVGNIDQWAERIGKGIDTLYANAINGIGIMPAKGGQSISDAETQAAVDFMLNGSQ